MKRLIVNADDFGMTLANTIGILHAHKEGIVTSTTCMINMPFASFGLEQAKKYPHLGIGLHLVLTVGKPIIKGHFSYVDENGFFKRPHTYENEEPIGDKEEVYQEWKAQIEKFITIAGKKPTHLDSHHHVHLLPWFIGITKKLSQEYDIPIRIDKDYNDNPFEFVKFEILFYNKNVSLDFLIQLLDQDNDTVEIMCHPAFLDQRLYDMSSYHIKRMKELEIITSQEIKDEIKKRNIKLIHYGHISKNSLS